MKRYEFKDGKWRSAGDVSRTSKAAMDAAYQKLISDKSAPLSPPLNLSDEEIAMWRQELGLKDDVVVTREGLIITQECLDQIKESQL